MNVEIDGCRDFSLFATAKNNERLVGKYGMCLARLRTI